MSWINVLTISNYIFHSYWKHTNIPHANLEKKKNEMSFERKYIISTLHTKLFNSSNERKIQKKNYFVLFVEKKTYKKQQP